MKEKKKKNGVLTEIEGKIRYGHYDLAFRTKNAAVTVAFVREGDIVTYGLALCAPGDYNNFHKEIGRKIARSRLAKALVAYERATELPDFSGITECPQKEGVYPSAVIVSEFCQSQADKNLSWLNNARIGWFVSRANPLLRNRELC
jgi:hypothetical protein